MGCSELAVGYICRGGVGRGSDKRTPRVNRALFIVLAVTFGHAGAQETIGRFSYHQYIDPITDQDRSYIITTELQPTRTRTGSLLWRCDGPRLELMLSADEYLNDEAIPIIWRFDRKQAVESRWSAGTNGTAAFAGRQDMLQFTAAARPAGRVIIRASDYRGNAYTYEFSLLGLSVAIHRLRCYDDATLPKPGDPVSAVSDIRPGNRLLLRPRDVEGARDGGRITLWRDRGLANPKGWIIAEDAVIVRDTVTVNGRAVLEVEVISRKNAAMDEMIGWVLAGYTTERLNRNRCFAMFVLDPSQRERCIGGS